MKENNNLIYRREWKSRNWKGSKNNIYDIQEYEIGRKRKKGGHTHTHKGMEGSKVYRFHERERERKKKKVKNQKVKEDGKKRAGWTFFQHQSPILSQGRNIHSFDYSRS